MIHRFKMKSLSLYVRVLIMFIRLVKHLCTLSMASISFNKNGDHISEQYSNNGLMYTLYAMVNKLSFLETKPMNSTPSLWYALFVIIFICLSNRKQSSTSTPKSRRWFTDSKMTLFKEYSKSEFFFPKCKLSYLEELISNYHFEDQMYNCSRADRYVYRVATLYFKSVF